MYFFIYQKTSTRAIVLFEVKKHVTPAIQTTKAKDVAQALVEGYYTMLGGMPPSSTVVVALTSVEVSHFFKLNVPNPGETCHLEVEWYNTVYIPDYPPSREQTLFPFIQFTHEVLDEMSP